MSIYSNVTEQDSNNLRKLAEQQKAQRALKIKIRNLKQAHDIKLKESLSPITKKLDNIVQSTKKIGEVMKESNSENEKNQEIAPVKIESEDEIIHTNLAALPNRSIFRELLTKTLRSLMSSSNSLKLKSSPSGATFLGVPIGALGGDRIRINDNIYDITPEIHKALSSTSYTGKTMKNENNILKMNNIVGDLGDTGKGDRQSNRKTFFTKTLPNLVEEIENKTFDEITDNSDDLQGEGVEILIPSKKINMYTRL